MTELADYASMYRERREGRLQSALNSIPKNLVDLPQLPFDDRQRLPVFCAVYFVMKCTDTVLYIGMAHNLRRRWQSHALYKPLLRVGATAIGWLPQYDAFIAKDIEQHCIKLFQPPFNYQGKSFYDGGTEVIKLTQEDRALAETFAAKLNEERIWFMYGTGDALRIAALRYMRGALFVSDEAVE
jgi:hypothetical protein